MRNVKLINALFLISSLSLGSAWAAEAVQATPAVQPTKLESIDSRGQDDCPMHNGQKKCEHKNGEPCPLHGKEHQHKDHAQDKCDHEHHKHPK